MAALQETKWFGEAVYRVGESVVLAAGRAVPGTGAVKQRREGVAILCLVQRLVLGSQVVATGELGALSWSQLL